MTIPRQPAGRSRLSLRSRLLAGLMTVTALRSASLRSLLAGIAFLPTRTWFVI